MPSRFVDVPLGASLTSVGRFFCYVFCSVLDRCVVGGLMASASRCNGATGPFPTTGGGRLAVGLEPSQPQSGALYNQLASGPS